MNFGKNAPCANARRGNAVRKTVVGKDEYGDEIVLTEKVPHAISRKFVSPSGNVSDEVLSTARAITEDDPDNRYGVPKIRRLKAKGWVLYAECPYANGWMIPKDGRVKPCKGTNPAHPGAFWKKLENGRYDESTCCEHVEALIKRRQELQRKHTEEFENQNKSDMRRLIEIEERKIFEKMETYKADAEG
jgi:hypothetical protein